MCIELKPLNTSLIYKLVIKIISHAKILQAMS